ncbi:hypothetical protein ATK17_0460 [Branchiibius hedensis]|uniref:HicA toxin of toxin-antitoxin n=1 Tax=Branchiibius hedensis TaxID=672460 RepID=A0A2Y8ZTK8_9MICO|nr:hypothetical protein [Branchiibius hedensis]PWJ24370.1 hypothetical protein ATK17_0460 [Branchiibius hedensis]SSA33187.1 hypothetical protein SAMN04489750_0460 [Branchiibius hedensis]
MTSRRILIKRISKAAKDANVEWLLVRQRANHEVYSPGGQLVPVPRHSEIGESLTRAIHKQAESKLGKGWWRQ